MKVISNPEVPVAVPDGSNGVISSFPGAHVSVAIRIGATHDRTKKASYFTISVVEATQVKKGKKVQQRAGFFESLSMAAHAWFRTPFWCPFLHATGSFPTSLHPFDSPPPFLGGSFSSWATRSQDLFLGIARRCRASSPTQSATPAP